MERRMSVLDHKFGAPRWLPPSMSIKARVGWVEMNKHLIMYWRIRDISSPANLVAFYVIELDDTLPPYGCYTG
jgi:hypothetical protein